MKKILFCLLFFERKIVTTFDGTFGVHQKKFAGGRYEPDLDDLGNAFSDLGIRLSDLRTMWSETEPNRGLPQVCCLDYSLLFIYREFYKSSTCTVEHLFTVPLRGRQNHTVNRGTINI